MRGWKTWTGAALLAGATVADALGYGQWTELAMRLGMAFGLVGVGHKIEKSARRGSDDARS